LSIVRNLIQSPPVPRPYPIIESISFFPIVRRIATANWVESPAASENDARGDVYVSNREHNIRVLRNE
jgi:hypothetical protein